jgi:methylated-DNA-[protein]-cysteine S-methyltransferase
MTAGAWVICTTANVGAIAVPVQTFTLERLNTPTGRMLIVTDDDSRLRALDWEDHEPRMQRLLQRHYGEIELRDAAGPSAAQRALQAYFEGELDAVDGLPTATNGTEFAPSGTRCAASLSGAPSATAPWRSGSVGLQRRAPWGSRMAPIPSPSSFPAIG